MKKVLFVGFKPIQLELARKFIEYRGCADVIEVVPEQRSSTAVDAYVANGDDPSVDSRLALHVRVMPGPVLCIGEREALGTHLHVPGAFRPVTVDRLLELLQAPPASYALPSASASKVVPFPSAAAAQQAQVLVVDDSEMVRRTMTQKISQYGHRVDVATTGDDAMAMLLNGHYRLVFLDVMMPGTDGFEVCKRIKRSREYKGCAVYMLTSKDGMFDKVRGSMAGCDGYLIKPLESRMLRQVLDRHFERPADLTDSDLQSSMLAGGSLTPVELAIVAGRPPAESLPPVPPQAPVPSAQAVLALEQARLAAQDFLGLPAQAVSGSDFQTTHQHTEFQTTFAPTQLLLPDD